MNNRNRRSSASLSSEEKTVVLQTCGATMVGWFLPVISAFVCNVIQIWMVQKILEKRNLDDTSAKSIFWKYHLLNLPLWIGTYVPYLGVPLQAYDSWKLALYTINQADHK